MKINEDKHSVNKLTDISKFSCAISLYTAFKRSCSFYVIIAAIFSLSSTVIADPPKAPASPFTIPLWKTGDTWKIRTWLPSMAIYGDDRKEDNFISYDKSDPIDALFCVKGFTTVKGQECVEIKVIFPKDETGFQNMYLLYFRKDLKNLIRIIDCSIKSNGHPNYMPYNFPPKANHPIIANSVPSIIPFDFPIFTDDKGEPVVKYEGEKVQQKMENIANGAKVIIVQKTKHGEIKCVQTWLQNSPWWHDLKKYKDGELIYEAIMIDEQ